jgi:hypothetical protein
VVACDGHGAWAGDPSGARGVVQDAGASGIPETVAPAAPAPASPVPSGRDLATFDLSPSVECENGLDHPTELHCTGLYWRWPSLRLAADVKPFDPGLHLWSDGADKGRFIWLPPGKKIDTSDMDEWVFPEGAKLWKEFSLGGHKIETRYLEKRTDGTWFRTTYAWSDDETHATELTTGKKNVRGTSFEIPTQEDCTTCHQGRRDGVLGFEAITLSSPHASGVTMHDLVDALLLTNPPRAPLVIPGDPAESAALGWLHVSCGVSCHNPSPASFAGWTGLHLRLGTAALGSVRATDTWNTAVGVESFFQPIPTEVFFRIAPGDVGHSAIPYRDATRDDGTVQMPPLGTHLVDVQGLGLVETWISAMR